MYKIYNFLNYYITLEKNDEHKFKKPDAYKNISSSQYKKTKK